MGFVPPLQALEKSLEYTRKANEIDSTISVAHSTLGSISMIFYGDLEKAEKEFKRSIELNPNAGWDRFFYSQYLRFTRHFDEAIAEAQIAIEQDPFNIYISSQVGVTYMFAGRIDEAIEKQKWTISIYPSGFMAHQHLGEALQFKSLYDEAVEAYEKAVHLSGGNTIAISRLACAYQKTGRISEGEKLIEDLKQRMGSEYVPASIFVPYYSLGQDNDPAYQWLEKACNDRDPILALYIIPYGNLYPIPEESRFTNFLEKVGLNQFQN